MPTTDLATESAPTRFQSIAQARPEHTDALRVALTGPLDALTSDPATIAALLADGLIEQTGVLVYRLTERGEREARAAALVSEVA